MRADPRQDLFDLLEAATHEGVFPGCVALVWSGDAELYHEAHGVLASHPRAPMRGFKTQRSTIYDLASLTKVLSTTTLTAIAVAHGLVEFDTPLPQPWAQACPGARLGDLLTHSAGLVAHREYFSAFAGRAPVGATAILEQVCQTPQAAPPGRQTVYSDLGFMILGAWLERLFDNELDRLFDDRIAWPLGLDRGALPKIGYHRLNTVRGPNAEEERRVAPTEVYDPTLHPEGEPSYFPLRRPTPAAHYEVHDDNAFAMGGVAGHAGLFGNAEAVAEIARAWLNGSLPGLDSALARRFWTPSNVPGKGRRYGFDGSTQGGSTGGAFSSAAVGHLGYTGCSLWIDPEPPSAPRIVVLLSNRVHPRRQNPAITSLRPAFHRLCAALD